MFKNFGKKKLTFEDVAVRYREKFDDYAPMLTTLDIENQKYLNMFYSMFLGV